MSDRRGVEPGAENAVSVGVLGDDAAVRRAATAAGVAVVDPADADVVVTAGEAAFRSAATDPAVDVPVLPVAIPAGDRAVAKSAVGDAVAAVAAGSFFTEDHPLLAVTVDGDPVGDALMDVTLLRSEPAKISEYAVTDEGETIGRFRADGVVAATPLGSGAYARAAGGPVIGTRAGVVVVPIGPFSTRQDNWVRQPPLTLWVARDEGPVTLSLDDRETRTVPPNVPVALEAGERVTLARVATEARDGRSQVRADWKNSNE